MISIDYKAVSEFAAKRITTLELALQEAIALIDEARSQPDDLEGEVDAKIAAFKRRHALTVESSQ